MDATGDATDSMVMDSAIDSGCVCPPPRECILQECVGGVCVESPVENGTECGEIGSICVDGNCVTRACGDGYREPGPTPLREGCDDGNLEVGDACDEFCLPTPLQVVRGERDEETWEPELSPRNHASVAVDDAGRVLVVFLERGAMRSRMMGRRFDRGGVALDAEPFEIDPDAFRPSVAGLESGWVIGYERTLGEPSAQFVVVPAFDTPMRQAEVARTTGGEVSVARYGSGFVAAWADIEEGAFFITARRFDEAARPLDDESIVQTSAAHEHLKPRVASNGVEWAVVWERRDFLSTNEVVVRRFDDVAPIDTEELVVASGASSPHAMYLDGGLGVTYLRPGPSFLTDVYYRVVTDVVSPETTVAMGMDSEAGPMLSANDGGYLASFFTTARGGSADVLVAGTTRPEVELLRTAFGDGFQNRLSQARASDGTWFVWEGDRLDADSSTASVAALLFYLADGEP